jgi:hypothetical protein
MTPFLQLLIVVAVGFALACYGLIKDRWEHELPQKGTDTMANIWRKRKEHDTWHFCTNCSQWPTSNYDESNHKPTYGELCNECKAKQAAANCR